MAASFYFYDLETTGVSSRRDRVMQFAGQRTDSDLNPVGEPDNILIKITPDVIPTPEAILITGITPQKTLAEGITEAKALQYLTSKVFIKDTIFVGFNNIRFDDEFMRFMLWRNFYDAYEWQWKDGRSRWDLLDAVRITRALRPEGIDWPFASDGKPTNKLSYLTDVNKLNHVNAHDALSDVIAAINIAKLIKAKQPKLFEYLLNLRSKQKVEALIGSRQPFIYTSGRYPSQYLHTTVAVKLADYPDRAGSAIVYDLRSSPKPFLSLSAEELAKRWSSYGKETPYFPAKILSYNRCPAVAPLNTLDSKSAKRLELSIDKIDKNAALLNEEFAQKLIEAAQIMQKNQQEQLIPDAQKAEEQLYDGFIDEPDKTKASVVRAADIDNIRSLELEFSDVRLKNLFPLYKARNFPSALSEDEKRRWDSFRQQKLIGDGKNSALAVYFSRINELSRLESTTPNEKYVLEELKLYGESIAPF